MPPAPAFYAKPASVDDLVEQFVARVLDQLGLAAAFARRWDGQEARQPAKRRTSRVVNQP